MDIKLLSVFVLQEQAKSQEEAERILVDARDADDFLGGRIIGPPPRTKRWLVDTYYVDSGGRPPQGMARLRIPMEDKTLEAYGLPNPGPR